MRRICSVPGRPVAIRLATRTVPPLLPSPRIATPVPAMLNALPPTIAQAGAESSRLRPAIIGVTTRPDVPKAFTTASIDARYGSNLQDRSESAKLLNTQTGRGLVSVGAAVLAVFQIGRRRMEDRD